MAAQRPVVVGVDESPGAEEAVKWAIDDAVSRKAPVRLVCAFRWTLGFGIPMYADPAELDPQADRKIAETAGRHVSRPGREARRRSGGQR